MSDYAESTTNQHGALVRRYYDLVDAKNIDGLLALFSDDAVYQRPGYPAIHGREAMRAFYTGQRIIEHGHHKLFTVISEDAQVSTRGEFRGQLKDGRSISVGFADFFTVGEGGLFTHRDTYFSMPAV
ncbi:nuclear transport factor 2 family protein [Streptomyces sp. NPDC048637]|uniref:nuclear transport factor 2 family protein n=1 Tax=Streptomyces sp. NPDC048637 TaxID=3155636 RepID=UPI003424CBEE